MIQSMTKTDTINKICEYDPGYTKVLGRLYSKTLDQLYLILKKVEAKYGRRGTQEKW